MNRIRNQLSGALLCMIWIACSIGCESKPANTKVESVDFYIQKLSDPEFIWSGPTSNQDRIPSLHAARALAYMGDVAVPALLKVVEQNPAIDKISLFDALDEIGLPVQNFYDDFYNGKVDGLTAWWKANRKNTLGERTRWRKQIGLPPPDQFDRDGKRK